MTRMRNCPDCEAIKSFNESLLRLKGVRQSYDPRSCKRCSGSGRVPEVQRFEKRRKDMSGEEWTEYDAHFERERERMERED